MSVVIDTIAAISTATGKAGISIIRISGSRSIVIANEIFEGHGKPPSEQHGNSFLHGHIKSDSDKSYLDEVIMLIYKKPNSYTKENVVEIQGHGGRACAKRILRTILNAGARLAEPGEFTKRAFLNGRIDLLQAEAVMDLISAQSDRAASAAIEQLDGVLSNEISALYDDIVALAADLEATLDFAEDELPETNVTDLCSSLDNINSSLKHLLESWEEGHLLREGAIAVISGKPNVGKSTLLNRLLGHERAIVTNVPGTTRDTIEEHIVLDGIPIRLIDTAGLRDAECSIEKEGIERALAVIDKADLNLHVVDASVKLDENELARLEKLKASNTVVILNKTDLGNQIDKSIISKFKTINCSLLNDHNIDKLKQIITSLLGIQTSTPPHAVISERHYQCIQYVLNVLTEAKDILSTNSADSIVLAATTLRNALERLGTVTGRIYTEELLDTIFERFCIGK